KIPELHMHRHAITNEDVLKQLGSGEKGLNDPDVSQKLQEFGRNELKGKKKLNPFLLFVRQFLNVMILVLVVAAVISFFIGEPSDTIVIAVIVVLNAIIGFVQEYRAEKAMEALQKMSAPVSRVRRNDTELNIPIEELVPSE